MTNLHEAPSNVELLDIVDEYGEPTGRVETRDFVHEHGLSHRDVHAWIINDKGELLQQQRVWTKTIMPGQWDISIGEHVVYGESYLQAARRGTWEEFGIDIPESKFIRAGLFASQLLFPGWKEPHNTVGDNFIVFLPDLEISDLTLQTEEVLDARWYSMGQMEADLANSATANQHAEQPAGLYRLGLAAAKQVLQNS